MTEKKKERTRIEEYPVGTIFGEEGMTEELRYGR